MKVVDRSVAVLHDAAAEDDVGIVGVDHRRVIAIGGQRNDDVTARQRPEVADQCLDVVAALQEHQSALTSEVGGARGDGVGEFAVGDPPIRGQQRRIVAAGRQMVE